jgi:acetyl esterase/lipase
MPLDRRCARLIAMLSAGETGEAPRETPADRREGLIALARMADDASAPATVATRSFAGPASRLRLKLYAPPVVGAGLLPALVFFHGGGWTAGDFATHEGLCRRLAITGACRVIAVDYRLAPEHPFPAAFHDALAAVRWVAEHAAQVGVDAARIAVGGDSVGAGMAAAVALALCDRGGPRLALQVLICPILDPARSGGSRLDFGEGHFISKATFAGDLAAYAAGAVLDDPRLAPARAASLAGLPPALVHTAEFDPFRDEGEDYSRRLAEAGVATQLTSHAGMIHYFYAMARAIPYASEAAMVIGAQMRAAFAAALTASA